MRKIHSFFGLFILTFLILCLLTLVVLFNTTQSNRIQSLALESQSLLTEWNQFENLTYLILLGRYTVSDSDTPRILKEWSTRYRAFSNSLDSLIKNEESQMNHDMQSRMAGAMRVWRYTEVQLNNASYSFDLIIQSGLSEKVMVNGFLHTMYKLRMQNQLSAEEIFLLDDTLYALEALDDATREFDSLITSIVEDLKVEGEMYLKRIRFVSLGLLATVLLILGLSILINRQLKTAQKSRKIYLENTRNQILLAFCRSSTEENRALFESRSGELGFSVSLDRPLLLLMVQVDDFSTFSHTLNLVEQQTVLEGILGFYEESFRLEGFGYDHFQYGNDSLIFLINPFNTGHLGDLDELIWFEQIRDGMESIHNEYKKKGILSITSSLGNLNTDVLDLDHDFSDLLQLSEYRFLLGKGQFIYMGSTALRSIEDFLYPQDKERLFEEAVNSLSEEDSLRTLDEMIDYGRTHEPRDLRRLILRLTATLSSLVEQLQRTYHLQEHSVMTPMIFQVQSPETIEEVRGILADIIIQTLASCRNKKEEKHDQTVLDVKEIIQSQLRDFNLSAESIADYFGLTTAYLNRLFKSHTAYSIAGYINFFRLERAELLLRDKNNTVAEICELSGFSNQGSFFRLFKKKYGRTPGDYQKEMQRAAT
ncbi:AraC family transcriptional regulator [Oceanispirochaeta sp.]|jgi:AraC-like DNA-binding protein|uniref:helix-turn-helix domain-containing protein n=1 Tax=Oceanispirochaeta sp. TaxID=2035350 RepID=UPI00263775DE|nr:AraC family transcriptional regulator [Oceanispirochaeta sp.]MDA3956833.1 AraC family transcriptional regulator [Oceanispirochaeta sp.]